LHQPIPVAAIIATEGGYTAALEPHVELLNDKTKPTAHEFVYVTHGGEVTPTGHERSSRTVYKPNFQTLTDDVSTNRVHFPIGGCYVFNHTHSHSIGAS
jgi:hypothetical protein